MLKKYISVVIILITLFYYNQNNVYAYEFVDENNRNNVNELITQIYDTKEQYEDLAGNYREDDLIINNATDISYWWPIGSVETTEVNGKLYASGEPESTNITSNFGYRGAVYSNGVQISGNKHHSGVDIANSTGVGSTNVIAAKSGVVVYPTASDRIDLPNNTNGGSYGNYVIIQHSDGNYTLYAHLHANTITVREGDSVEQGQVIAKMGNSGNSSGSHLHFEVRKGFNKYSAAVNPLDYISQDNPREVFTGNEFLSWLEHWEGADVYKDGDYYKVVDIGDGVRTVGAGVTLEYNPQVFAKYNINIDDYPAGSKMPVSVVNQIEMEIIEGKRNSIEGTLSDNSITLQENQIQSLICHMYNTGNIVGFVDAYKEYGNTQALFDNWMNRYIMIGTEFETGLRRRRNAEWTLFHTGKYIYNN